MSELHGPLARGVLADADAGVDDDAGVDELANKLVDVVQEIFAETPPDFDQNVAVYVFELARTLDTKIRETGLIPQRWLTATQRSATASSPYREPAAAEPTTPEVPSNAVRELDLLNRMAQLQFQVARDQAEHTAKAARHARLVDYAKVALVGLLASTQRVLLDCSRDSKFAGAAFDIAEAMIAEEDQRRS